MAVNDITKILDFQTQRPAEVATPEPVPRREPSDYQKALSRSVSSADKRRSADRSTKRQQPSSETEPVRSETRPQPAKIPRSDDRKKTTVSSEPSHTEQDLQPREIQGSATNGPAAKDNSSEQPASPTSLTESTDPKQDAETQPNGIIANGESSGLVATPPQNLHELFPAIEPSKHDDEATSPQGSREDTISPPQGLALSLNATNNTKNINQEKPATPVPWNEALWQELTSNEISQPHDTADTPSAAQQEQQIAANSQLTSESVAITAGTTLLQENSTATTDAVQSGDPSHQQTPDVAVSALTETQSNADNVALPDLTNSPVAQNGAELNGAVSEATIDQPQHKPAIQQDEKQRAKTESSNGSSGQTVVATNAVPVAQISQHNGKSDSPNSDDPTIQAISKHQGKASPAQQEGIRPAVATTQTMDGAMEAGTKTDSAATQSVVTGTAKNSSGLSTTERADFAERVMSAVRGASEQNRPFRVRLNPPELGSLQVEITQRDGIYSARLEVQTTSAQQAILDHVGHLKESLQQNGIRLDRIEVQLNPSGPDDQTQDGTDSRQQHSGSQQDHSENDQNDRHGYSQGQSGEGDFSESSAGSATANDQMDVQI